MQDFSALLKRLAEAGLDFVIIGGFAAVTHGSSYVTQDIDICALLTPENVSRLRQALAEWNPRHRMTPQRLSFLQYPADDQPVKNLYLQTDKGVIDILSSVMGVGEFERLKQQAEEIEVDGTRFRVMSLRDLISAKEALGREKDLLTARELRLIAARRNAG
ncbi:putative nucleotidyltransferase [Opitutaceae bacterium TAV1]|nr:putative nucleotidyltransferase [Opitutaceae bacterium TAV1]